jgi:hypothetical protein
MRSIDNDRNVARNLSGGMQQPAKRVHVGRATADGRIGAGNDRSRRPQAP